MKPVMMAVLHKEIKVYIYNRDANGRLRIQELLTEYEELLTDNEGYVNVDWKKVVKDIERALQMAKDTKFSEETAQKIRKMQEEHQERMREIAVKYETPKKGGSKG